MSYQVNYDLEEDILYIMSVPGDKISSTKTMKHGIEMDFDIYDKPINIVIPDASVTTGASKSELKNFSGNNLDLL